MEKNKTHIQTIWGIALILAGVGMFFRIPVIMPQIETVEYFSSVTFFIRFCLYLIGVMLIGGGSKKLYNNYQKSGQ